MRRDNLDTVPHGFRRSKAKGWLKPLPSAQAGRVKKLEAENQELRDDLAELRSMVEALTPKKKKKS